MPHPGADCRSQGVQRPDDLQLVGSSFDLNPQVGSTFNEVVSVRDLGPDPAPSAAVTDDVGTGLSVVSASSQQGPCDVVNNTVRCALGALPAGGGLISLTLRATQAGPLTSHATVVAYLALFVALENRSTAPLVKLSIFRIRSIAIANSAAMSAV